MFYLFEALGWSLVAILGNYINHLHTLAHFLTKKIKAEKKSVNGILGSDGVQKTTKSLSLQFQKFPCGAVKSFSHVRLDVFGDSWDKATESHRISNECWARNTWIWSLIVIFTPGFQQSARVSCHRLRLAPLYSAFWEMTHFIALQTTTSLDAALHSQACIFFPSVISFWRWDCESAGVRLSLTFTVEWLRVFSSFVCSCI